MALVNAESYIANPINAYLFVKKFTTELPKTKELVSSEPNTQGELLYNLIDNDEYDFDVSIRMTCSLLLINNKYSLINASFRFTTFI